MRAAERRSRSACSNSGYTCTGITTPRRLLAGCGHRRRPPSTAAAVGHVVALHGPVEVGRRPCARRIRVRHASAPPMQHEVGLAGAGCRGGPVDERLRAVAARRRVQVRVARRRRRRARRRARRVAVAPREQSTRRGPCRRRSAAAAVADAAVVGGPAQRLGDRGRPARAAPSPRSTRLAQLAATDQHRCAGIDHGLLRHSDATERT